MGFDMGAAEKKSCNALEGYWGKVSFCDQRPLRQIRENPNKFKNKKYSPNAII
jgi:hypothetical protein